MAAAASLASASFWCVSPVWRSPSCLLCWRN